MIYAGALYFYVTNQMGDVVKLVNSAGTIVAEYSYNAWGEHISSSSSMASINPLRYHGYYFDEETGLYYVNSRYYDSKTCRFINADIEEALTQENENMLQYNLYAYLCNNSVNMIDDDGEGPQWATNVLKVAIGVGAISGDRFKTAIKKVAGATINGFASGFMTGGIMAGAGMTTGALLKNSKGLQFGTTAKPQYGKVNIGYGTPGTNGATILSLQNSAGKSLFRFDFDSLHAVHMHLPFILPNAHIPIGSITTGLYSGIKSGVKK